MYTKMTILDNNVMTYLVLISDVMCCVDLSRFMLLFPLLVPPLTAINLTAHIWAGSISVCNRNDAVLRRRVRASHKAAVLGFYCSGYLVTSSDGLSWR